MHVIGPEKNCLPCECLMITLSSKTAAKLKSLSMITVWVSLLKHPRAFSEFQYSLCGRKVDIVQRFLSLTCCGLYFGFAILVFQCEGEGKHDRKKGSPKESIVATGGINYHQSRCLGEWEYGTIYFKAVIDFEDKG